MLTSSHGWQQVYNLQSSVNMDSYMILGGTLTQATNDKQQLQPKIDQLEELSEELRTVKRVAADTGYFSQDNANLVTEREATPYIFTSRRQHHPGWKQRLADPGRPPEDPTLVQAIKWRLKTEEGREFYPRRKSTVEPVFGNIKHVMGFRQFLLRGLEKATGEWKLVQCVYNLKRMHTMVYG